MVCLTWGAMSSFFGVNKTDEVAIVPISELREHEMPHERRVCELEEDMTRRKLLLKPIVADSNTKVILDGHCRCRALRNLGCSKVAVKFVDYKSNEIEVGRWNGGGISKKEVIEAGLSGNLMMPKSSMHIVTRGGKRVHISETYRNSPVLLSKLL